MSTSSFHLWLRQLAIYATSIAFAVIWVANAPSKLQPEVHTKHAALSAQPLAQKPFQPNVEKSALRAVEKIVAQVVVESDWHPLGDESSTIAELTLKVVDASEIRSEIRPEITASNDLESVQVADIFVTDNSSTSSFPNEASNDTIPSANRKSVILDDENWQPVDPFSANPFSVQKKPVLQRSISFDTDSISLPQDLLEIHIELLPETLPVGDYRVIDSNGGVGWLFIRGEKSPDDRQIDGVWTTTIDGESVRFILIPPSQSRVT